MIVPQEEVIIRIDKLTSLKPLLSTSAYVQICFTMNHSSDVIKMLKKFLSATTNTKWVYKNPFRIDTVFDGVTYSVYIRNVTNTINRIEMKLLSENGGIIYNSKGLNENEIVHNWNFIKTAIQDKIKNPIV